MDDDAKAAGSGPAASSWLNRQLDVEPVDRIYVNRNLRMSSIEAIGFDMDHTLANYKSEPFESLAFQKAQEKLVSKWGYPSAVLRFRYDNEFVVRGLVVDKRRGNILKMDEHRYITKAYHGTKLLAQGKRKQVYANRRIRLSGSNYSVIDSLFSLPEIALFAQMVDFMEGLNPRQRDFRPLYEHVRDCVDEAHADGSIKNIITKAPKKFCDIDPELPQTLQRLRAHGKKLFLLTNSEPDYSDSIMSLLLNRKNRRARHWTDYFDAAVLHAGKPSFFVRRARFEEPDNRLVPTRNRGRVAVGGSVQELEKLIGRRGDKVLYFGDHTYGDILRSKHSSGWRTAMVLQDLEDDLKVMQATSGDRKKQFLLTRQRDRLVGWRDFLERSRERRMGRELLALMLQQMGEEAPKLKNGIEESLGMLDERILTLDDQIGRLESRQRRAFNHYWGPIFKAGKEHSLFGAQVRSFACIYTTKVSNFLNYPVDKYFEAPREFMPHEL